MTTANIAYSNLDDRLLNTRILIALKIYIHQAILRHRNNRSLVLLHDLKERECTLIHLLSTQLK